MGTAFSSPFGWSSYPPAAPVDVVIESSPFVPTGESHHIRSFGPDRFDEISRRLGDEYCDYPLHTMGFPSMGKMDRRKRAETVGGLYKCFMGCCRSLGASGLLLEADDFAAMVCVVVHNKPNCVKSANKTVFPGTMSMIWHGYPLAAGEPSPEANKFFDWMEEKRAGQVRAGSIVVEPWFWSPLVGSRAELERSEQGRRKVKALDALFRFVLERELGDGGAGKEVVGEMQFGGITSSSDAESNFVFPSNFQLVDTLAGLGNGWDMLVPSLYRWQRDEHSEAGPRGYSV